MSSQTIGDAGQNPSTFDTESYLAWRAADLGAQCARHFQIDFTGRDVLDFGCGGGGLSFLVAGMGARSITGIDVAPHCVADALKRLKDVRLPVQPRFFVPSNVSTIDLPDASIDVVLCFDTLEHIEDYEAILGEWRRVLRERGRVLIWWCPWYHPYGHHIESLVPLPWAHVVFPERVLTEACARIYDLPEFAPRMWDLDEQGRKKPNKWHRLERLPDVNRLTIHQFERACRVAGLHISRRQVTGFGGSAISRLTRLLTRVPRVRDFFAAYVVYELTAARADPAPARPGGTSRATP